MRKQFRDTVLDIGKTDARIVMVFGDVSVYLFKISRRCIRRVLQYRHL
jgi:hypothetical protein